MSITRRTREALDRQRIPQAGTGVHGYRVDQGLAASAIVRWGHNEPFRAVRNRSGLASCSSALNREGLRTVLDEISDPGHISIVVTEQP